MIPKQPGVSCARHWLFWRDDGCRVRIAGGDDRDACLGMYRVKNSCSLSIGKGSVGLDQFALVTGNVLQRETAGDRKGECKVGKRARVHHVGCHGWRKELASKSYTSSVTMHTTSSSPLAR